VPHQQGTTEINTKCVLHRRHLRRAKGVFTQNPVYASKRLRLTVSYEKRLTCYGILRITQEAGVFPQTSMLCVATWSFPRNFLPHFT